MHVLAIRREKAQKYTFVGSMEKFWEGFQPETLSEKKERKKKIDRSIVNFVPTHLHTCRVCIQVCNWEVPTTWEVIAHVLQ